METYERDIARLEIYDKLAQSQAEVAAGSLLPFESVFENCQKKYGLVEDDDD